MSSWPAGRAQSGRHLTGPCGWRLGKCKEYILNNWKKKGTITIENNTKKSQDGSAQIGYFMKFGPILCSFKICYSGIKCWNNEPNSPKQISFMVSTWTVCCAGRLEVGSFPCFGVIGQVSTNQLSYKGMLGMSFLPVCPRIRSLGSYLPMASRSLLWRVHTKGRKVDAHKFGSRTVDQNREEGDLIRCMETIPTASSTWALGKGAFIKVTAKTK